MKKLFIKLSSKLIERMGGTKKDLPTITSNSKSKNTANLTYPIFCGDIKDKNSLSKQ